MLPGPAIAATAIAWSQHMMIGVLLTAVPVMAPALAADLGVEPALVGYYSALIWATAMVMAPVTGGIIERIGPVRAIQLGFLVLVLGAIAGSFKLVIAIALTAILLGVVSTIEGPASSALLIRLVPRPSLNIVLSMKQTGFQMGAVLGGLAYPIAVLAFGWTATLLALIPIFLTGMLLADWFRRRDEREQPAAAKRPLTRRLSTLRLVLSDPALRALSLMSMNYSAVQLCVNTCFVTYAVTELSMPLPTAAAALATAQAMGFVGRVMWGAVADRLIPTMPYLIGTGVVMAGLMAILGLAPPSQSLPAFFGLAMLVGLIVSGWNGVFMAEVARRAPADRVAATTSGVLTAGHIGLTVGPLAFTAAAEALSFGRAFALLGLVALVGAVTLAWNARSLPRS